MRLRYIFRHPRKAALEEWRDELPVLKPVVYTMVALLSVMLAICSIVRLLESLPTDIVGLF